MSRRDEPGTVYLIHFDRPVADHARHYLGWASDPRLCPDCTAHPRPVTRGRSASAAPAARPAPEPVRDPGPAAAWPGRPLAAEAAAGFRAEHEALAAGLIAGWRADAGFAVPAPRQPEPEPELEMEMEI